MLQCDFTSGSLLKDATPPPPRAFFRQKLNPFTPGSSYLKSDTLKSGDFHILAISSDYKRYIEPSTNNIYVRNNRLRSQTPGVVPTSAHKGLIWLNKIMKIILETFAHEQL